MQDLYVTTPIYYVNGTPHIGHAYTTVLGDVMARYRRLFGARAYYVTGTDEHGQKVQDAAAAKGVEPQAYVDSIQSTFRDLWPTLGIEVDDFIRTTEDRHVRVVQQALSTLWDKGEIYLAEYEGWYSPAVERFWAEKDLVDGKCPESGGEVSFLKEKNYWFKMSAYQERLLAHIHDHEDFIVPQNRRNEVLGFLAKPLQDLCISRPKSRLSWGIELPFDAEFVTYVWFDALLNYATAAGLYADPERFALHWPNSTHLIGKDILTTHCVYWNTMLMALGIELPRQFVAHGWWLIDNTKMSKSLGNVVDPLSLKDTYGPEVLRYYLMRDMNLSGDASFSEEGLVQRNNADLANDLGNLLSRTTKLLRRAPWESTVPQSGPLTDADSELVSALESLPSRVEALVSTSNIQGAIEASMAEVRRLNKYINDTQPFRVVKEDADRAGAILYNILEGLRICASCLWPVIPEHARTVIRDVGGGDTWSVPPMAAFGALEAGQAVTISKSLFPKAEFTPPAPETEPAKELAMDAETQAEESTESIIQYDDFAKIELVVVEIVEAEAVPKSEKLLKLQVDLGSEQRTVVSGIAKHYDPERIVGRRAVLLKNLAPRKIFGIQSQGMLLAASDEQGELALVTPEKYMAPGAEVS